MHFRSVEDGRAGGKKQDGRHFCDPLSQPTWATKDFASLGASVLESPATIPRLISFTDTFLTLNPTLSPGSASVSASWCISTDLTSVVIPAGAKVTTIAGFRIPVSTRPTGTVPIPAKETKKLLDIQSH